MTRPDCKPVPDVNACFFKETPLDELLVGADPLQSMEELAIEDFTCEEGESVVLTRSDRSKCK